MINLIRTFASSCSGGSFFGLPTWYYYLPKQTVNNQCVPVFKSLSDTWLVVAAIIEMLLRIAGIGAVIMIIIGGINYSTSMGDPDATTKAKNTIIYSLVGLIVAITAAIIITFIASSFNA